MLDPSRELILHLRVIVSCLCLHADQPPQPENGQSRVVQEGSQIDVLSLVASGAGVAIVPASLRVIRRAGVLYRPLIERPLTQLDMIWRKNAASPVLHGFLDEVRRVGAFGIRPNAR
jgi:DNA-binding transcriptional LysR family regulator